MDPFTLEIGIKTAQESEVAGEPGLVIRGYASRYHEVDRAGERQLPGAFKHIDEEWGAEREPLLLWQHGLDPDLGTRRLGRGLRHRLDDEGLYIEAFIPKQPRFKDGAAVRRFRAIYEGITSGSIKGLSVGGSYLKTATGAIKRWSLAEVSVTDLPCLPSATFTVGAKAIGEAYGALPPILDDEPPDASGDEHPSKGEPVDPPQHHSSAAPTIVPLAMPAGNVTVSAPVGATEGAAWTLSYAAGTNGGALAAGDKAVTKKEGDGARHPRDHYLVAEGDNVSDWHLQVKNETGAYDRKLCAQAYAALVSNFRGNPYQGPGKGAALKKLRAIYKSQGWDWPADQESGSEGGKKAQIVQAGLAVLRDFEQGSKQGRQHSAATLAAVKAAIDLLEQHFGLAAADDEQEPDEAQSNALVS